MKSKKALCVFAHPDDETFGPGGTIAFWSKKGYEIHLICATKGENGGPKKRQLKTGQIRSLELKLAAKIIGIKKIEFLGLKDGSISNNDLQFLEQKITHKIKKFKPDYILTFNLNGVSGHMDHVAVASATTQAFKKTKIAIKLYYYTLLKPHAADMEDYFIHFPEGYFEEEIDESIDISNVWNMKVKGMHMHKSQINDINRILKKWEKLPKKEYFIVRSSPPRRGFRP